MVAVATHPEKSLHGFVMKGLLAAKGKSGKHGGWRDVAEGAGVSFETIRKIASGRIANPRVRNLEKLAGYLRANRRRRS
jgi:transcriptional regulator with XRE-family HTH domain